MELGKVIGENLKRLRADRSLSLDALAASSGVSKSRLGQIERGEANPSISTVWQIASALHVEFTALVSAQRTDSMIVHIAETEPVASDDGRCRTYPLFPFDPTFGFEFYATEIDPGGRLHAAPHPAGSEETLAVTAGCVHIITGGRSFRLAAGDALRFRADAEHEYVNEGDVAVSFTMIVAYPRS